MGWRPLICLRREERLVADVAELIGVPPEGLVEGVEKRLASLPIWAPRSSGCDRPQLPVDPASWRRPPSTVS